MTTIIIENKTLYTDSLHISLLQQDSSRSTKIAFNDSRTLAYAYTGPTMTPQRVRSLVELTELELMSVIVDKGRARAVADNDQKSATMLASASEVLLTLSKKCGKDLENDCLALARDFSFHVLNSFAIEISDFEYRGIGCYIPSYVLYRKMGCTPLDAFNKIFNFSFLSAGPVNVVHANMLNEPDAIDYLSQISDGVQKPVLRALKKPEVAAKTSRRSTKTKTK